MESNDRAAVAAHLHVLLRRHLGRVTDVQWMAEHADYAQAMVALARSAGVGDLAIWADKLEALIPTMAPSARPVQRPLPPVAPATVPAAAVPAAPRYVRSLR